MTKNGKALRAACGVGIHGRRRLIAGLKDALAHAHARGELALQSYTVRVPDTIDVAKLRKRLGSRPFGVSATHQDPVWPD